MKRIICAVIAVIVIILTGGFALTGCHLTTENTERTETLIIDLSKRLPDNPYQEEYERMLYPTVRIKAGFSIGSGVVIGDYILSAAHVINAESIIAVETFFPEHIEIEAAVILTDTVKDLALIRPSRKLPYSAQLASKEYKPFIFNPVYAVGCSLGLIPRPSNGIITAIHPSPFPLPSRNNRDEVYPVRTHTPQGERIGEGDSYWEISAPILPGNSGGPVYAIVPSDDGNASTYAVIGIAVWVQTYQGQLITTMAGVVPVSEIYEFLKEYTD